MSVITTVTTTITTDCPNPCASSGLAEVLPPVVVLPVSGQALTGQMGIMLCLMELGYRAKLTLGASGGAMVAAHSILDNWQSAQVAAQLSTMCDVSVLRKHYLGELQAIMEPSIYLRGSGLESYYNLLASGNYNNFRCNELIINAYNTNLGRTELFSTTTRANSVLNNAQGPLLLLGVSCEIHFLGELPDCQYGPRLREVLAATSAVPLIFDRVAIGPYYYADGGVSFSSPLNAVSCLIDLRDVLYINPIDIDEPVPAQYGTVMENAIAYTSQITRSNALQDRYMYLHSLCCGRFNNMCIITNIYNCVTFANDLASTAGCARMVELYPLKSSHTPMTVNDNYESYMEQVASARVSFGYRIFYVKKATV